MAGSRSDVLIGAVSFFLRGADSTQFYEYLLSYTKWWVYPTFGGLIFRMCWNSAEPAG